MTVSEGKYAAIEDGVLRFYNVDLGKDGTRWEGFVFLSVQSSDAFFPIKDRARKAAVLAAIETDPEGARRVYGHQLGVCGICGLTLTDETSRRNGIGPVCASKHGFAFHKGVDTNVDAEAPVVVAVNVPTEAAPAAPKVTERSIGLDRNKFGPVFVLRWNYNDAEFAAIKDEVKGWDWNTTKRAWNPDLKAWTVDAKSVDANKIIQEFASRREFKLSAEAQGRVAFLPDATVAEDNKQRTERAAAEVKVQESAPKPTGQLAETFEALQDILGGAA